MYNVNNDMDDVFRKAGENYPLDTTGADWDRIAAALNHGRKGIETDKKKYTNNFNKLLLLILMIHLPYLCDQFLFKSGVNQTTTQEKVVTENKVSSISKELNESIHTTRTNKPVLTFSENSFQNEKVFKLDRLPVDKTFIENDNKNSLISEEVPQREVIITPVLERNEANVALEYDKKDHLKNIEENNAAKEHFNVSSKDTTNDEQLQKISLTDVKRSKRFYAGFIGGVNVTTVKFQKTNDPGNEIGLLVGYKLNNKWSIEAAVLSTLKNYSTEGEYFNSSKITLPYNTKITSVTGSCRMIELPISVRYNLNNNKNNWFLTAGVSNWIMKREDYDYVYLYMNSGRESVYSKTYLNSPKEWMSIIQLSGGVTKNYKQLFDFRIEPYIQVPVKGVGFGDLPLTSAGLRIGISKNLF